MFMMAIGLRGLAQKSGPMPNEVARVTALLGALVLLGITATALAIIADSNIRGLSVSAVANCSSITEKAERLNCYDRLARPPAGHPFRGANAPALGSAFR